MALAQNNCASGMRSSMSEMRDFGCQLEKMNSDCQAFFYQNPDLLEFSKDCKKPGDRQTGPTKWFEACKDAGITAWTELWTDLNKADKAIESCNAHLDCKKKIALEAYFACPDKSGQQNFPCEDEAQLNNVDVRDLLRKRESVRSLAEHDEAYRIEILSHGAVLPDREAGFPFADLIAAKFRDLNVKAECFNGAGYMRMACYALASVVDPTLIASGATIEGLKGAKWISQVMKGMGEKLEAAAAANAKSDRIMLRAAIGKKSSLPSDDILRLPSQNLMEIPLPATPALAKIQNTQRLEAIANYTPRVSEGRKAALSQDEANKLFKKIDEHPVTGTCALSKYDPENSGLCYGRSAAYVTEALKTGVNKDSLRKVFVVGDLKDPQNQWRYHVATIVKSQDGGWWALDPTKFRQAVPLHEWYDSMQTMSHNKPVNLFVTDTRKVTPKLPGPIYNSSDWSVESNQYFQDYFKSVRDEIRGGGD